MNENYGRIIYADVLRIAATFSVIVIHVAASRWYVTPVNSFDWLIMNFFHSVTRWAVPNFFMLSGMFFLSPNKKMTIKKIYSKYILRIVTALIFWGLAYNFLKVLKIIIIRQFDARTLIISLLKMIAKIPFGPAWYHLWFLYSIIALYIVTPLFRTFVKNAEKKDFDYLLVIFAIFGLTLPMINFFLIHIDSRLNINFSIVELTGYAGYFFAGYYFSNYEIKKKTKDILIIAGLFSIIFTVFATSFVSLHQREPNQYFYGSLLPTTMFSAYGVFLFVKTFFENHHVSEKARTRIVRLSKLTFGVYLIHDFFNIIFNMLGFTIIAFSPVIAIPVRAVLTFCLSTLIISIMSRIPVLNKYVM